MTSKFCCSYLGKRTKDLSALFLHAITSPPIIKFRHSPSAGKMIQISIFNKLERARTSIRIKNLIIGGDVIACKNKALKSFVLFPR